MTSSGAGSRHPTLNRVLALLILSLPQPLPSAAEIYKWTDENGKVHYGDQPDGENAVQVHVSKEPVRDGALEQRMENQQQLLDVFDEERQRNKQSVLEQKAALEKRQFNCQTAKKNLEAMVNSSRVYEKTGDPYNPKILSDEEREAATSRARKDVAAWCGGNGK
jgi:hypothetical protein